MAGKFIPLVYSSFNRDTISGIRSAILMAREPVSINHQSAIFPFPFSLSPKVVQTDPHIIMHTIIDEMKFNVPLLGLILNLNDLQATRSTRLPSGEPIRLQFGKISRKFREA